MMYSTTVTQKGQITLPAKVRKFLGVTYRDSVVVRVEKGRVLVEPARDILDMAGSVRPVKGVDAVAVREEMEKVYNLV